MSRTWKRANGEDQKEIRRREICDAALALNETCPFSEMTLADIARYASFTRSNLYKYYACREDLFLQLLSEDFLSWVEKTEEAFSQRSYGLKEFSHIWVEIMLNNPRLPELLSLSTSTLEKNAGEKALSLWYDTYKGGMDRLNRLIRGLYPTTEKDDINEYLLVIQAQITGFLPLLELDVKQSRARRDHHLPTGKDYYREILCHALESLLEPWI